MREVILLADVTVTIDGKKRAVSSGSTILDGAKNIGIEIPKLGYMKLHNSVYKCQPACCRVCC